MVNSTAKTKKEVVLRSFPVPVYFKNLLATIVANHPDYKNTKEFIIECFEFGRREIEIDRGVLKQSEQLKIESSGKLTDNIVKELKEFLKNHDADSIIAEAVCETGISWNMDKDDFLKLKSLVPLSKYRELRRFYIQQIYKGLERMI